MAVIPVEADITLLNSARQMNKEALVKIFDLYSSAIYNYALRICNDPLEADHIVGDVFAKLLEQFSNGHGPNNNLRSYLFEATYHLVIDRARSARRQAPLEAVDFLRADGQSTVSKSEDRILFESVIRIIKDQLTEDQRHVIVLRFLEGFSLQETATIIGKAVSNVKVIQNRAISALRKSLDHQVVK